MPKVILFVKFGGFSQINSKVSQILRNYFCEYELHSIDIYNELKKNKFVMLMNLFFFLKEYAADILFGYKDYSKLKSSFFLTSYFFKKVKSKIRYLHIYNSYTFSFQTQSLFDCSYHGVVHFIYTDHTTKANYYYPNIDVRSYLRSKPYMALVDKFVYQNATKVFVYSNFVKRSLLNQYGVSSNKVEVVGVGPNIDISKYNPIDNRSTNKNILFVGIHWKRKGGELVIEAFKKVLSKVPDATLTIVGCSPSIKNKTILKSLDIQGRVSLDEVHKFYNKASVFFMPTQREPFGVVFLEAFSYRLPVVTINIGAIAEFLHDGKNGFLFNNNDVNALSNALIYLLNNPDESKKFGEYGKKIVDEFYNWKVVSNKICNSIEKEIRKGDIIFH